MIYERMKGLSMSCELHVIEKTDHAFLLTVWPPCSVLDKFFLRIRAHGLFRGLTVNKGQISVA